MNVNTCTTLTDRGTGCHGCSFEAPGLLSGMLGTLAIGALARRNNGLPDDVPCMRTRRLTAAEAGQAVPGTTSTGGAPGHKAPLLPRPADEGLPAPAQQKGAGAGSEAEGATRSPVIEFAVVAAPFHSAAAPLRTKAAASQQQEQVGAADAQGLIHALAATSLRRRCSSSSSNNSCASSEQVELLSRTTPQVTRL